jgi:hypothetical protein
MIMGSVNVCSRKSVILAAAVASATMALAVVADPMYRSTCTNEGAIICTGVQAACLKVAGEHAFKTGHTVQTRPL